MVYGIDNVTDEDSVFPARRFYLQVVHGRGIGSVSDAAVTKPATAPRWVARALCFELEEPIAAHRRAAGTIGADHPSGAGITARH